MQDVTGITSYTWDADGRNIGTQFATGVASINSQDAYGQTAIMKAIKDHNITNVNKLIRSGAILLIQDCRGKTAYDLAVANRDNAFLSLLPRHRETFGRKL